jgi:hypothetical protein
MQKRKKLFIKKFRLVQNFDKAKLSGINLLLKSR